MPVPPSKSYQPHSLSRSEVRGDWGNQFSGDRAECGFVDAMQTKEQRIRSQIDPGEPVGQLTIADPHRRPKANERDSHQERCASQPRTFEL